MPDPYGYATLRNHINKHLRSGGHVILIWDRLDLPGWPVATEHVIDGARIRRNKLQVREVHKMTSIRRWKPWRDAEYELRYEPRSRLGFGLHTKVVLRACT